MANRHVSNPHSEQSTTSIGRLRRGLANLFSKDMDTSAKGRPLISSPANPVRHIPMPSPTFPAEENMPNICPDHDPHHKPVYRVMNPSPTLQASEFDEPTRGRVPRKCTPLRLEACLEPSTALTSHPTPHSSPERQPSNQRPTRRRSCQRPAAPPSFESRAAPSRVARTAHVRRPSTGYRSDGQSTVHSYRTGSSRQKQSGARLSRQFVAASPGKISVATPTRSQRSRAPNVRARHSIRSREVAVSGHRRANPGSFATTDYASTNEGDLESIAETQFTSESTYDPFSPTRIADEFTSDRFSGGLPDISQTPFSFSEKDVKQSRLTREVEHQRLAEAKEQERQREQQRDLQQLLEKQRAQKEGEARILELMQELFEKQNGRLDKRLQEVADAYYLARPWSPEDVAVRIDQRFNEEERMKEQVRRHESRRQRAKQNEYLRQQRDEQLAELQKGLQRSYENSRQGVPARSNTRSATQSSLDSHSTQSSEELVTPPRYSALRPRFEQALKPAPLRLKKEPRGGEVGARGAREAAAKEKSVHKEASARRLGGDPGPNPNWSPPSITDLPGTHYARVQMAHDMKRAVSQPNPQSRQAALAPEPKPTRAASAARPPTDDPARQTAMEAVAVNGQSSKLKPAQVEIKGRKNKSKQKKAAKLRPFPLVATRDSYEALKMRQLGRDDASESGDGEWETLDVNDLDASPDRTMSWQHLNGTVPSIGSVGLAH